MQSVSHDEKERLEALHSLKLLDTPPRETYDRVTALCTKVFDCANVLITLIDEERIWFLSKLDDENREVPREGSLSNHVLAQGSGMVVGDAAADERFADCPRVATPPHIRSFMACPIRGPEGHFVGTLGISDERPNRFSEDQLEVLQRFVGIVEDLIQLHSKEVLLSKLNQDLSRNSAQLSDAHRIFAQAEKIAKIGFWELEIESERLSWSDEVFAIHGLSRGHPLDVEQAIKFYHEDDRDTVIDAVTNAIRHGTPFDFEATIVSKDGTRKRIRSMGEKLDRDGQNPERLVGVFQDISEAYHARMDLQRAADHDSLTNIFNRHAFDRCLQDKIRMHRQTGDSLAVMLFDLDGFKDINDTFGHMVGDVVLEEVSSRIARATPSCAVLARWGGDEFAVIPPMGSTDAETAELGQAILDAIEHKVAIAGRRLSLSATCGFARQDNGYSAKELVRRADLALYHGKKREPGRVHRYDDSLEHSNHTRQTAIDEVRSALDDHRIFAAYQPIVDLANNRMVGLEALMRLNTKSGTELTATQVLPGITEPILSREIGERMLDFVCHDLPRIRAAQPELQFISLNATEADLLSREFGGRLLDALAASNVDPRHVTLEVTETMLMVNDSDTVREVLTKLQNAGMMIALDDFGTGFSSLSHLKDFPIDKVKIDRTFIQSICTQHQTRLIVQALIGMACNMQIGVIAEGIETEEQRNLLMQMGCGLGQGYLISPAQTVERIALMQLENRSVRNSVAA